MKAQTRSNVLRILDKQQARNRSFGVRRCGFFASFLREEISQTSKVDLFVEFEPGQETFLNSVNLIIFLEKVQAIGLKVDLKRARVALRRQEEPAFDFV